VVILSNDTFNENSDTVIAVAVTSQRPAAQFPLTVEIRSVNLPKRSWAKMGQVRTLSSARLGKVLGRLSSEELKRIIQGLGEILGAGPNA
jgi:mRNA interferase MazF